MDKIEKHIEINGYHATSKINIQNILKPDDFVASDSDNEWLGNGVYFWKTYEDAIWWATNTGLLDSYAIIKCSLICSMNDFLDLDKNDNIKQYNDFVVSYNKNYNIYTKTIKPMKKLTDIESRNFFLTLYARKFDVHLIKRTFEQGPKKYRGMLRPFRTQMCVPVGCINNVIKNLEVVYG